MSQDRIPQHSMDVTALTNDTATDQDQVGQQYAVLIPDGQRQVYGDQRWVAYGEAAKGCGGVTVYREVTVTYGPWQFADPRLAPPAEPLTEAEKDAAAIGRGPQR